MAATWFGKYRSNRKLPNLKTDLWRSKSKTPKPKIIDKVGWFLVTDPIYRNVSLWIRSIYIITSNNDFLKIIIEK